MCSSGKRAVLALDKLSVYIGLKDALLGILVVCCRCCLFPVFICAVSVTQLRFCEDQPALRLREDTRVLLNTFVEAGHECTVKTVINIRRIHNHRTVRSIQFSLNAVHSLFLTVSRSESRNNCP